MISLESVKNKLDSQLFYKQYKQSFTELYIQCPTISRDRLYAQLFFGLRDKIVDLNHDEIYDVIRISSRSANL